MRRKGELSELLAAERAERPLASVSESSWRALQQALAAHTPALPVAHGPLHLGLSLAAKSFLGPALVAFAVTTSGLGAHAVLKGSSASEVPASPSVSAALPSLPAARNANGARSEDPPVPLPLPPALTRAVAPSSSPSPTSTFTEELRLIKAAKQELDGGRGHLAQVWLDEHERSFPRGIFRTERQNLRARLGSPVPTRKNSSPPPSK